MNFVSFFLHYLDLLILIVIFALSFQTFHKKKLSLMGTGFIMVVIYVSSLLAYNNFFHPNHSYREMPMSPFNPGLTKIFEKISGYFDLTERTEQNLWAYGSTNSADVWLSSNGIQLGVGEKCDSTSWISRDLEFSDVPKTLNIDACAILAGGDGTKLRIEINNFSYDHLIPPNSCNTFSTPLDSSRVKIQIESKIAGNCAYEDPILKALWIN